MQEIEHTKMTIENLSGGAALAELNKAIQAINDDIQDLEKEPAIMREITFKIKFKPAADRGAVDVEFFSTEKLGKRNSQGARVYSHIEKGTDKNISVLDINQQPGIPEMDIDEGKTNLRKIGGNK